MGKRVLDLIVALPALMILSPVLLLVAILVRLKLGSPIVFIQERPGPYAKPFRILKFRSITNAREEDGELLHPGQRLTPLGRLLRRSSLDELLQLPNGVRGDLNLVGPRPLLIE